MTGRHQQPCVNLEGTGSSLGHTVRHDRIGELRASSSPCSPEEWETILKALLLGGEQIEGIEAGAEANVGKSITITIRRRVAGINVREFTSL